MTNSSGEGMLPDFYEGLWNPLVRKINTFHVICVYDSEMRLDSRNQLKRLTNDILRGKQDEMQIFSGIKEGESFFVWEEAYQKNKTLFFKLREEARNDVIFRISVRLAAHFLKEYAGFIRTSLTRYSELQNMNLLDTSITKLEGMLKSHTFLAENAVWDEFCHWFKHYLAVQVLTYMEQAMGRSKLESLSDQELNQQFHQYITRNLQMDSDLMQDFTQKIEQYLQQWLQQVISSIDVNHISVDDMKAFLNLEHIHLQHTKHIQLKESVPLTLAKENYLNVMSNVAYQFIRETLSNKRFNTHRSDCWPVAFICKNMLEGTVQVIPYREDPSNRQADVSPACQWIQQLSEADVDVFDSLCSFFLSHAVHREDIVRIKLQDLLMMRGLKAKRSGSGRRGGFEKEQIEQVLQSLAKIQSLWVHFSKAVVYEKGKQVQTQLEGRVFRFFNQAGNEGNIKDIGDEKTFSFGIGEVFVNYLVQSGRQIALQPLQSLQYNPHQEEWEKKLIRYLSWRWRTQAKKQDYQKPYKVDSLLTSIGKEIDTRTPSRTRERLEQALDKLQEDNLVLKWEYLDWDESIAARNGWSRIWAHTKMTIQPPKAIQEHYHSISGTAVSARTQQKRQVQLSDQLGSRLKTFRKRLGLTLTQVAGELELSAAYISTIERGKNIPSPKVVKQIESWIQHGTMTAF